MSREFWSSTVDYDVVVVGARCAGAATALLLARSGVSVLVIDRARYGSDTLSTHAFTPPGVLQLGRWGLLDAIRAAGTPTVTSVVQHYDGTLTPSTGERFTALFGAPAAQEDHARRAVLAALDLQSPGVLAGLRRRRIPTPPDRQCAGSLR